MKLPELIRVRVLGDGKPLPGAFVCIQIKTNRKNDFALAFGPADDSGALEVSREALLSEAEKSRNLFLMDYGHPEADFAGQIVVEPFNLEAIERALAAYRLFRNVSAYSSSYAEDLENAHKVLATLGLKMLHAEVEVEDSEDLAVQTKAVML